MIPGGHGGSRLFAKNIQHMMCSPHQVRALTDGKMIVQIQ